MWLHFDFTERFWDLCVEGLSSVTVGLLYPLNFCQFVLE